MNRRRCDECGVKLELVKILGNKYYFCCPACGLIIVFTLKE